MTKTDALLTVEGLKTHFFLDEGIVRAVDGVDLSLARGKTVCIVGESGCGKSMTARSILGLVEPPGKVIEGNIWWQSDLAQSVRVSEATSGPEQPQKTSLSRARRKSIRVPTSASSDGRINLAALDARGELMRRIRGNEIAMIFQEPMASLSPMYTVGDQLVETIRLHMNMGAREARDYGISLLKRVGIPRAEQRMDAYPWQLSGGMCQRVMIAIALSCEPNLLIADEPTTALDVTTQARIVDLLAQLQADTGMSMMFITHDLGVVAEIADEVIVMYLGTVVEQGKVDEIFHNPKHPYTQALLESIPTMGLGARQRLRTIRGSVPPPLNRPAGCPFHPRCAHAIPNVCDTFEPPVVELNGGHRARCVLHSDHVPATHERHTAGTPNAQAQNDDAGVDGMTQDAEET